MSPPVPSPATTPRAVVSAVIAEARTGHRIGPLDEHGPRIDHDVARCPLPASTGRDLPPFADLERARFNVDRAPLAAEAARRDGRWVAQLRVRIRIAARDRDLVGVDGDVAGRAGNRGLRHDLASRQKLEIVGIDLDLSTVSHGGPSGEKGGSVLSTCKLDRLRADPQIAGVSVAERARGDLGAVLYLQRLRVDGQRASVSRRVGERAVEDP